MDYIPVLDDEVISFSKTYEVLSTLGKGSFGKVYRCVHKSSGRQVAVKVISKPSSGKHSLPEAIILAQLNHPSIVRLYAVRETEQHILFEMELLKGGSLKKLLRRRVLSDEEAAEIMRRLLSGVAYLHEREIIHRDLKPANILFATPHDLTTVKITDFGLSFQFEDTNEYKGTTVQAGTMIYMAPEQATNRLYSKTVDIWSCGIILHMLVTGKHPLLDSKDDIKSYLAKLKHLDWELPESFPPLAAHLFRHLAHKLPLERFSAEKALTHPWITRTQGLVPMTYIEKMRNYNDEQKLKRILHACMFVSLLRGQHEQPDNKISLFKTTVTLERPRRMIRNSVAITRNASPTLDLPQKMYMTGGFGLSSPGKQGYQRTMTKQVKGRNRSVRAYSLRF